MEFKLTLGKEGNQFFHLFYDPEKSEIRAEDGNLIDFSGANLVNPWEDKRDRGYQAASFTRQEGAGRKAKGKIHTVKIRLGTACNYKCRYCFQAHLKRDPSPTLGDVEAFTRDMRWINPDPGFDGAGLQFEFWGGEPLVYWPVLKPLMERLRETFPASRFLMVTNGTLIDAEKADFLEKIGVSISMSHDGPGQSVRGADPFDDPVKRDCILGLYKRLAPKRNFCFAPTVTPENQSRKKILDYFVSLTGDEDVKLYENDIVEPFNPGGLDQSPSDHHAFRAAMYQELMKDDFYSVRNYPFTHIVLSEFVKTLREKRPLEKTTSRCCFESPGIILTDLKGNVMICNNVSLHESDWTGRPNIIGNIADFDSIRVNPELMKRRARCGKCPVVQLCKGGCPLHADAGALAAQSCQNFYSVSVVFLALALFVLTGAVLVRIDGDFPEDRKDIFGLTVGGESQSIAEVQ